ncbi:unnamed protein product [Caenorhabditis nigoni]
MPAKLDEASGKDPKVRAGMIFYEFQSGEPIFKCFKNFFKRMGPDFMDYLEFEFWWMRFSAGNFDLNYDRSKDPKYRTITDIPVDIFEKVCENLGENYQEKYWFTLRHVCKSFRNIVDSWDLPKFNRIEIGCYGEAIVFYFNEYRYRVGYYKISGNSSKIDICSDYPRVLYSINQYGNYQDLTIDDLMSILVSPGGHKLENLHVSTEIESRFAQKLSDRINNLGAKIDLLFKLPHLEYCHVDVWFKGRLDFEKDLVKVGAKKDPENPDLYKYRIPETDDYFEVRIQSAPNFDHIKHIYIERKSNSA